MKNVILAATLAANFGLGAASAQSITLSGGLGIDKIGGGNQPTVAVLSASTVTANGIGLRADGVLGLRSAAVAQTALIGTLYLPAASGLHEFDFSAVAPQQFGSVQFEPGLDVGAATVLGQQSTHAAYLLLGGLALNPRITLDGQARVGVASGGQLYAGADVGLSVNNVANGTVTASYQEMRDGSLPRQGILSVTYSHALRF